MDTLTLFAPLSGRLMPIEKVPDPVFAQKLAGDGIALDPTSHTLIAPCDGAISQIHPSNHALTITASGIEIMIHIGLDTAALQGEGFLRHVKVGSQVKAGQTLIEFDPDYVAIHGTSLLTMIIIKNSDRVAEFHKAAGDVEAGKQILMELTPADYSAPTPEGIFKPIISESITVPNLSGIHLRPAAVLSSLARGFFSEIQLKKEGVEANAKSVSSIMGLNISYHDQVRLSAAGPDAYEAINILTPAIINGLGEKGATPIQAPASTILPAIATPIPRPPAEDPNWLDGIGAAPGMTIGSVYQLRPPVLEAADNAEDPLHERRKLDQALDETKLHLEALRSRYQAEFNPGQAALIAAQYELMDDVELLEMAISSIGRGMSAALAWQTVTNTQASRLEKLNNKLLRRRAAILRDAGMRVANRLTLADQEELLIRPGTILIAEDISAVRLANLDHSRLLGMVTVLGGPTTEAANIARSLNIPAISGIETRALEISNGTSIIVDGSSGQLHLNPSAEDIAAITAQFETAEDQHGLDLAAANQPAVTLDDQRIAVCATAGGLEETRQAMKLGSDSIGLLRSEYIFTGRRTMPSEDTQTAEYTRLAMGIAPQKTLTVRALNSSIRSQLPFLPHAPEPNPALGQRGIRAALNQPQVLRKQSRAVLRAAIDSGRQIRLLLPMIATIDEWHAAKGLILEEQRKLEIETLSIGLLVQTPAAAILAEQFAREVDFFTIDTDYLAQISLAMDHSNPHLAAQIDALNPAVLKLIDSTVRGASIHEKTVALCGSLAGDPRAIPILIGLGIKELDVHSVAVPALKAQIRTLSLEACREMAQQALSLATAAEVRAL